jgi:hypothetical protein
MTDDYAVTLAAPAPPAPAATTGTVLFQDHFDRPDGLITNEYAYWNPTHSDAVISPDWEMTSGSPFARTTPGGPARSTAPAQTHCRPRRPIRRCSG